MAELFQLAAILLAGPLLLTVGAVAWMRHDQRRAERQQSAQWQQRFLDAR